LTLSRGISNMNPRELTKLQRETAEQGWTHVDKKDGVMFLAPDGIGKVMIHKTPSDWKADLNMIKRLEALGFKPRRGRRRRG
jgi:hypothetical protein